MKKYGFTLAEVLITLGIIGVIAAMTLPTLIQKQHEKEIVTALKKFHSLMSQAYVFAVEKNGPIELWGLDTGTDDDDTFSESSKKYMDLFSPYLKTVKRCKANEANCYAPVIYKYINGNTYMNGTTPYKLETAALSDGMVFSIEPMSADCTFARGRTKQLQNICASLFVDVNGVKNPNVLGKDVFSFYITKYGLVPRGTAMDEHAYNFENSCAKSSTQTGYGCAAWVIYNENLDYLHCDDLSWNGKRKCKQ